MRRTFWFSGLLTAALALSTCVVTPARVVVTAHREPTTLTFYETLSPYGEWVVVTDYGRVWRPHQHLVGPGFVPYLTGGRWEHTTVGWVFEAEWSWGWLPFHYGRWYEDDVYGWVWVPDHVWGASWVEWRYGGGYVGWVPLGPPRHAYHPRHWCFVPSHQFVAPHLDRHRMPPDQAEHYHEATAAVPPRPPSGYAWSAWAEGPPVDRLREEGVIAIVERTMTPPRPVTEKAVFPERLAPVRDVARAPSRPGDAEPLRPTPRPERDLVAPEPLRPAPRPERDLVAPEPLRPAPRPERDVVPPEPLRPAPRPERDVVPPEPLRRPEPQAPAPIRPTPRPGRDAIVPAPVRRPEPQAPPIRAVPRPEREVQPFAPPPAVQRGPAPGTPVEPAPAQREDPRKRKAVPAPGPLAPLPPGVPPPPPPAKTP